MQLIIYDCIDVYQDTMSIVCITVDKKGTVVQQYTITALDLK